MKIKLRVRSKIASQIKSKVAMVPFGRTTRAAILNGNNTSQPFETEPLVSSGSVIFEVDTTSQVEQGSGVI